ncbi:MAG TPA: cyclic nucleotide-binding domain-containing protein [Thermoanaerobaculia bacterium]|nr:cyclic nucleotide-binding domain-containing protein [Thermoanaerobaculia bacterium]
MTGDDTASGKLSIATLMATRSYDKAVPLLRAEVQKYPTNVRTRLQFADALAATGSVAEAIEQYGKTARYYDDSGLIVQAIAVRKKLEKLEGSQPPLQDVAKVPTFNFTVPRSPLFEELTAEEREALVGEMVLEQFDQGDLVITEGDKGSSLYVIVSGEVKVYSRGPKGDSVYLAMLGEGDFFGEVSLLTGKPRTATITASQRTELLRLDKDKLDRLIEQRPHIREILNEFYKRRAGHTVEAMIESLKGQRNPS